MEKYKKILLPKNNYKPWLVSIILFVSDLISISLSFFAAYLLRDALIPSLGGNVNFKILAPVLYFLNIVILGLFVAYGFYPGSKKSGLIELQQIILLVSVSFVIVGLAIYIFGFGSQISRFVFIAAWIFSFTIISLFRLFIHNRGSLCSWWGQPVVVIGKKKDVAKIIAGFKHARRFALKPVVALILDANFEAEYIDGVPAFSNSNELQQEIRSCGIKLAVFVTSSNELNKRKNEQIYELSLSFPDLIYVMDESTLSSLSMKPLDLAGLPAIQVQYNLLNPWARSLKRLAELIICFLSIAITLPFFLVLAVLIHFDSPGPIIFVQERVGKGGKRFNLYKFRTMVTNADEKLVELLKNNNVFCKEYNKYHKIRNDPRITRMGRFLRKTSLDEFPQIWNVVRGEMSLVGPRAYMPEELDEMGDSTKLIERVSPGLTGWWQVMGRHDVSFQQRLQMDEFYIINYSLWMDLYISVKTVWIIISGQGE